MLKVFALKRTLLLNKFLGCFLQAGRQGCNVRQRQLICYTLCVLFSVLGALIALLHLSLAAISNQLFQVGMAATVECNVD